MGRKILLFLAFWAGAAGATPLHFALQHWTQGHTATLRAKDLSGQYLLLAIGYTHCPDICPTTLYDMGQILRTPALQTRVTGLFVTIDPQRDNAHALQNYVQLFSPHIIGLTGSLAAISDLTGQINATFGYQVAGKILPVGQLPPANGNYDVFHSTYLYLFSPARELLDVYDYNADAATVAQVIQKIITTEDKK